MRRPYLDLHGYTLEDALKEFHLFIGQYMINGDAEYIEIITGNGIIKEHVIKELDQLGLEYSIRAHNLGRILVVLDN